MKVLVALDNRPSSQASIDALIKMHWHEGTEIEVVTVFPPAISDQAPEMEEMESVGVELRQSLRNCEVSFFARKGEPQEEILAAAAQARADLIVVGSNCKSTLERLLLGSVCQTILNKAECPVIVAKTPCCLAREASPGFRTILVHIDKSAYSDTSIQWLCNFNWDHRTQFILTAVVEEDSDFSEVRRSLQTRASHLSALLETSNITTEIAVGQPQKRLIELSKTHYTDMIVMNSHGHSEIKDLLLGNIAQSVSHDAPCAVAIVRTNASVSNQSGKYSKIKTVPIEKLAAQFRQGTASNDAPLSVMPGGF